MVQKKKKRQKNIFQMKEQENLQKKNTMEMEVNNFPNKEFKKWS